MLIRAPAEEPRANIAHCKLLPFELELEQCRTCVVPRRVACE